MRIPSNIIQKGKYTIGNEFVYATNQKDYQGYYYELNNKFFAGKEFKIKALEIIKKFSTNYNTLLDNKPTAVYSNISQIKSQQLPPVKINSIPTNSSLISAAGDVESSTESITYYAKKLNLDYILIKQVDKKTYIELQQNPFYQTISLLDYQNLDQADKIMPGLKTFLEG